MLSLCATCNTLELRLKSFLSPRGTDNNPRLKDPIRALGRLDDISRNYKTCALCRLVFAIFQSGPLSIVNKISDLSGVFIFAKWINALGPDKTARLQSPSLCILLWAEAPSIPLDTYKVIIRAISDLLPAQPHFGRLSLTQTPSLDYTQLRRWLQHCEVSHDVCAVIPKGKPTKHFFVIDVLDECIVAPEEPCRYVALSYVWGGVRQHLMTEDNLEELRKKKGIREEHVASTIRDAMTLTKRLGERYLWCDALCVVQDSKSIRQQTLQDMGTIYVQSLVTIVAGSCNSADDHLPGVSRGRHWMQWFQKISASLTVSAHFDFKDYLEDARYSERAWTFQEYQLAKRLLIFAKNDQVYFSCKEAVYSEEVLTGTELDSDAPMQNGAELVKIRPNSSSLWPNYEEAVRHYTGRELSNQEDVLDAFSGVLHTIHDGRCIEGIPKPIFDTALLWQPRQKLNRRKGFPSWSWIGWKGRVHWTDVSLTTFEDEGNVYEVRVIENWIRDNTWIVWHSSSTKAFHSLAFKSDGPPWLLGSKPDSKAHEERFPGLPQNSNPTPTLMPDRIKGQSGASHDQRYLQFWTISVQLNIELERTAVLRYTSLHPGNTGNGLRRFIINDHGRPCGWVLLDEHWIERVAFGDADVQEFILLSESSEKEHVSIKYNSVASSESRRYNAMMVIWHDGIAERTGLGQVTINALTLRKLEWKEVLLG